MGAKVTFDPLTRIITVTQAPDVNGDIFLDVKVDLYSDGKEDWVANENLRRLAFPVVSVGGNPLPGAKSLGATFFLASDWKIKPYEASHRLTVNGNLYSVDGGDPFIDTVGTYTVRIMQQVSSLVDSIVQQQDELEFAAFGNRVTLDVVHGTPGTEYPIGTMEFPSNNWKDLLVIAGERGFHDAHVCGNYTFESDDVLDNMIVEGDSRSISTFTMTAGVSTAKTIFENATLVGALNGTAMGFNHVLFDDVTGFSGGSLARDCLMAGSIVLTGSGDAQFINCYDGLPGIGIPAINFGSSDCSVGVWGYHGGLKMTNKASSAPVSVNLDTGRLVLDDTITDGAFIVRGVGEREGDVGGTATIDDNGLLARSTIAAEVDSVQSNEHGTGSWRGDGSGGAVGSPFDPTGVLP